MNKTDKILLNHGSGGKLTLSLISDLFMKNFSNHVLGMQTDSAIINTGNTDLAFTTDSFVVDPVFFPGGDIGKLAICGTVNDLAVSGAKPLFISVAFILEEGLLYEDLEKIVMSMAEEARKAGVAIVTGDTKVVEKGKCDKIFINTSGIGSLNPLYKDISFGRKIKTGDQIIINGNVGDHGIAILSARKGLSYKTGIVSDCTHLNHLIAECLKVSSGIRFMRDATRGGVATVLCELVSNKNFGIEIFEENIPVDDRVMGLCEAFGFDPLYVANEGKVVMVVEAKEAEKVLKTLKKHPLGENAAIIGEISSDHPGRTVMMTSIGGRRIMDMLAGDQLPRIC